MLSGSSESQELCVPLQVLMIGFIGRLDYQKGADLILGVAPWLLAQDVQLVCLGTGDPSLEVRPGIPDANSSVANEGYVLPCSWIVPAHLYWLAAR